MYGCSQLMCDTTKELLFRCKRLSKCKTLPVLTQDCLSMNHDVSIWFVRSVTSSAYRARVYKPRIDIVKNHFQVIAGYYKKSWDTLTGALCCNDAYSPGSGHVQMIHGLDSIVEICSVFPEALLQSRGRESGTVIENDLAIYRLIDGYLCIRVDLLEHVWNGLFHISIFVALLLGTRKQL